MALRETLAAALTGLGAGGLFASSARAPQAARSIAARNFIHDGARRSEGDANYSWLWVGAERHIRILLGDAAPFRRFRVVAPKATPAANLRHARLTINGEVAPVRVEDWESGAGALYAEAPDTAGELVVGVAVPESAAPAPGEAPLSICIDRIEAAP